MATPESVAIRRTAALTRVEAALATIAETQGVEIAPYPEQHKRPEVRPAIEAEWLADALEAVAGGGDGEAIEGVVQEMPDLGLVLQRLCSLAIEDEMVRLALQDAGFIQAKQDEDGGDWSVSIVGLGADLFPAEDDVTDGEPEGDEPESETPPVDLHALKLDQLKAIAAEKGIEGADKMRSKAEVIAAIEAAG